MIMCVLLCYPLSIHMSQLLSTGRPISSLIIHKGDSVISYEMKSQSCLCFHTLCHLLLSLAHCLEIM